MQSPFPGMDPYLEDTPLWRAVHQRLISAIDEQLSVNLPRGFITTIEERAYIAEADQSVGPDALILRSLSPPTVAPRGTTEAAVMEAPFSITFVEEEVHERFIEIRLSRRPEPVVAVIEVLSPTNKMREAYGRDSYVKKREELIRSAVHFVEIDLLRAGLPTVAVPPDAVTRQATTRWDYITCLHRAREGKTFHFWPMSLRQTLPVLGIPLTEGYPSVAIDLQACVDHVYRIGHYDERIDYALEPVPPLSPEDAAWADALLKEKGFR